MNVNQHATGQSLSLSKRFRKKKKKNASSVPGLLSPKKLLLLSKRFRKKKQRDKRA
jgi:hypothetical protein